jgi:uncharacterized protein
MEEESENEDGTTTESLDTLTFEEARVLGSLIEKELTTPEYYPMSLNGLVNACNQKNNRLPRSELSEEDVERSIEELRIKRLVHRVDLVGSRVPKFQHNTEKELDLIKAERALLSELLNRGPQTTGELNSRANRMFEFDGLSDVDETLQEMEQRRRPLVGQMDPVPGKKERRWHHNFGPPPRVEELQDGSSVYIPAPDERLDQVEEMTSEFRELKDEVEALRYQLRELSDQFKEFRKEFE